MCKFLTVRPENEPRGQTFIEQARRAQIVAAAVEVIAEVGYAKASLAAIAVRAGISKGVISYHFSGKDELMVTIVETIYGEAAAHIVGRMEGLESPTELVRTHVTAAAEYSATGSPGSPGGRAGGRGSPRRWRSRSACSPTCWTTRWGSPSSRPCSPPP
jgi:AcrR family transcriptional regulator